MILLAGLETDDCLSLVAQRLRDLSQDFLIFDQRELGTSQIRWKWSRGTIVGSLSTAQKQVSLDAVHGVYMRLENHEKVFARRPAKDLTREMVVQDAFMQWTDLTTSRVITREGVGASNSSKPYQLQIIAANGFDVPETIVTNSWKAVEHFRQRHPRIIYKSTSGVRSIVQEFKDTDLQRLDSIKHCPVQFQELIQGLDVRVHVVGHEVLAVAIETSETDYRYGKRQRYANYVLPAELSDRCVKLARTMGLEFAGIDIMITGDGKTYCFEVNPMPGYAYFQLKTGADIAGALARLLTKQND